VAFKNPEHDIVKITEDEARMKSILVLGGTGAMGRHLVNLLVQDGYSVCVTTRSSRTSFGHIEYIQGDAMDDDFLDPILLRKWHVIVDFMIYSTSFFKKRAPKLLAATDQYIFLSSARVYDVSSEPIQEFSPRLLESSKDSRFLATDEYSLAKARQEDILRQSNHQNWTIVRPYITYSEQRLQLGTLEKEAWLYRALKGRTIVFSKDIATKLTTLTYGRDVAAAMASLIGNSRALADTYHITQSQAATWQEVLDVYLDVLERHLGHRPKVFLLDLEDFLRCKVSIYQIRYDRLFHRTFNNSKISDFCDVKAFEPLEQGLAHALNEFLKNPQFGAIDWRSEAIKDRFSREIASLVEISSWKSRFQYIIYRFIKS